MKTILLWDPRFPDRRPVRLTVEDTVASAAVRAGVAAAANPAEAGALSIGGMLDPGNLTEVVLQHGTGSATRRVFIPYSVAQVGAAAGVLATIEKPIAGGVSPAPTLTMTQLTANRIYQRSTITGGTANKGTGLIDVPITLDGAASAIEYRFRDADSGTVVQDWTTAATNVAATAKKVTCPNVPALLGWQFLDLRAVGGTAQLGTARISVGRLTAMGATQSQGVRYIGKMPDMTETNASLNVAISPNCSVYARYTDSSRSSPATPTWAPPADGTVYDSTFLAEFLRLQVAAFGVNCGFVGYAVGETKIESWVPGQQNYTDLATILDAVGGFEATLSHIGGTDAGAGTSGASYQASQTAYFNDLKNHNAARGNSFERYVCAMATRLSGGAGSVASVQAIRKAAQDGATANGAVYLEPHDVVLHDNVHNGQPGGITSAWHLHRATQPATDNGPTLPTVGSRVGTKITMAASATLDFRGAPGGRFTILNAGTSTGALAVADASASGATITITLSADPGDVALEVYWLRHPDPSKTAAATDMIYDTYAADNLPIGRHLRATTSGPVSIPAPGGTPTPTPSAKSAQVNFRSSAATTSNPSGWNAFDAAGEAPGSSVGQTSTTGVTKALLAPDGTATGWTLTTTQASQGAGTQALASGVTYPYPDDVVSSYWFNGNSSVTPASSTVASTLHTVTGMNPAKTYKLTFFGSRTTGTARQTAYASGGQSVTQNSQNNVTPSTVSGLAPNSSGVLTYTYTPAGTGQFGYLNGLLIEEQ